MTLSVHTGVAPLKKSVNNPYISLWFEDNQCRALFPLSKHTQYQLECSPEFNPNVKDEASSIPAFSLFIQFSVTKSLTLNSIDGDIPDGYNEGMRNYCYFPDSSNNTYICESADLTGSTIPYKNANENEDENEMK